MSKTNTDLIKDIMNFSKYGALSQIMVMQAIEQFTDTVISNKESLLMEQKENEANNRISFINISSWIGVAEEIKEKINNNSI